MLDTLESKIRHIQVYSNKIVDELLAGEYHSVFKGHGMEFNEVREYEHGDEIRTINWQITARVGRPFVKRYVEERELTLFFLVDLSGSGSFGSGKKSKNEVAAELCALLAFSAIKNSDKVGLIIFTDRIEHIVPPGRGKQHVLRIIRELLSFQSPGAGTDIRLALDYFGHLHAKKSVAFIVSDFQDEGFEDAMSLISKRHDLIAVSISDPAERSLPAAGLLTLRDPETDETVVIDTSSARVRRRFKEAAASRRARLSDILVRRNVDEIAISVEKDLVSELIRFFKTRERRGQHG
ncbi:MAG: DUF58 domain-containing protein [Kiritimatiellia bacterium]|jgi:uncharacterized protein (DUF58 family)|nr:DUF58 domain-containing protein [Kiritimatiellia bacterium]MDP6847921.1 DUF58 domain-containing protein [Kiritimatiellia bacterium]